MLLKVIAEVTTNISKGLVHMPREITVMHWKLCLKIRNLGEVMHFSRLWFLHLLHGVRRLIGFYKVMKVKERNRWI